MAEDLEKKLTDHATLIRKMDAIANAKRPVQTNEATAKLLDRAAKAVRTGSRAESMLLSIVLTLNQENVRDYEGNEISELNVLQGIRRLLPAKIALSERDIAILCGGR